MASRAAVHAVDHGVELVGVLLVVAAQRVLEAGQLDEELDLGFGAARAVEAVGIDLARPAGG